MATVAFSCSGPGVERRVFFSLRDYTPEETVYVGDSLLTDAELAKVAGVDFVHVDPTQGEIGHVGVLCDMLR